MFNYPFKLHNNDLITNSLKEYSKKFLNQYQKMAKNYNIELSGSGQLYTSSLSIYSTTFPYPILYITSSNAYISASFIPFGNNTSYNIIASTSTYPTLQLTFNSIGNIPNSIQYMDSLKILDLCDNNFKNVPKVLYKCEQLECIYLSNPDGGPFPKSEKFTEIGHNYRF